MTSRAVEINLSSVQCSDILEFQDALKRLRNVDDKIIYELNTTIPTDSFAQGVDVASRCQCLHKRIMEAYKVRDAAIRKCISEAQATVTELKRQKELNPDDLKVLNQLRKKQTNLRMLQSEINVEEVIKDRTMKAFYERCRNAYRPSDIPLS